MYFVFPAIDRDGIKYKYIPNLVLQRLITLGYYNVHINETSSHWNTAFTIYQNSNKCFSESIYWTADPYEPKEDHELGDFTLLFTTDYYRVK